MNTKLKYYILGIVSILLILAVIGCLVIIIVRATDKITITQAIESSNNKYKAYILNTMGGGAAGYCSDVVKIVSNSREYSVKELSEIPSVFITNCGVITSIKWENEDTLIIKHKMKDGISLTRFMSALDRNIRIKYLIETKKINEETERMSFNTIPDKSEIIGIYSSFKISSESGDIVGIEINIIPNPIGHSAIIQGSEGAPAFPVVEKLTVSKNNIEFNISENAACGLLPGKYKGVVKSDSLILDGPGPSFKKYNLRKGKSFWQ